jgi:hypothetical protein
VIVRTRREIGVPTSYRCMPAGHAQEQTREDRNSHVHLLADPFAAQRFCAHPRGSARRHSSSCDHSRRGSTSGAARELGVDVSYRAQ